MSTLDSNCFNTLYESLMNENIGLGPMQFNGQGTIVWVEKPRKQNKKKNASVKKRSKK